MAKTKRKIVTPMSVKEVFEYQTKFFRRNTVIESPKHKKPKHKPNWANES